MKYIGKYLSAEILLTRQCIYKFKYILNVSFVNNERLLIYTGNKILLNQ